jgi:hypothetical protein
METMEPGLRVRCRRTGRLGVITEVVDPPRRGRSLYVVWGGSIDFSLMSPDEIELDLETPRSDGRAGSASDTDWRALLIDADLEMPGDGG